MAKKNNLKLEKSVKDGQIDISIMITDDILKFLFKRFVSEFSSYMQIIIKILTKFFFYCKQKLS